MTEQNSFNEKDFSILLNYGNTVLKSTYQHIKEKFSHLPVKSFEYIRQGHFQLIAEIRFEKEKATLSCEFDAKNICINSYLFPDKPEKMDTYISYLNRVYDCKFPNRKWKLSGCYVSIRKVKDIFFFMFS